jgi:A/G-specific adenine glycosylase
VAIPTKNAQKASKKTFESKRQGMATTDSCIGLMSPKAGFADALIAWYRQSGRDLPWRQTKDPYRIWLSEIMLQQTQVTTVIPYYEKFLALFPTVQHLAEAPNEVVLKAWEGLGYYARCRNLHQAAKHIVTERAGVFPDTLETMNALPGVGQSTAGAILTFSQAQRHPILDGNVKRVLSRLFNEAGDLSQKDVTARMWAWSAGLLSEAALGTDEPFDYNQAIMELGATCCTPKAPNCLICPVQSFCDAFQAGTQNELPTKGEKKTIPHHVIAVGVIWDGENILIQRRPEKGLLGGLWEFPGGKQEPDEALKETVRREIQEELGIQVKVATKAFTVVKHAYTHFKITLYAYHCQYQTGTPEPKAADAWQWIPWQEVRQFAFPKANVRVLDALEKQAGPPNWSEKTGQTQLVLN